MIAKSIFQISDMPLHAALQAIRSGLPAKGFDLVAKTLLLSGDQLAKKLDVPIRTIRYQKKRAGRLSPVNSEKLVRAVRIHRLARTIFTTDEAVAQWMASAAPALQGQKPIDLIDTDIGGREVESVLQGIAFGNVM